MLFLGDKNWRGDPVQALTPPPPERGVGVWEFLPAKVAKAGQIARRRRERLAVKGWVASCTLRVSYAFACLRRLPPAVCLPCRCINRINDPVLAAFIPL